MTRIVQSSCLLILCLSGSLLLVAVDAQAQSGGVAPPPSEWQRYTIKNEEFSITLPTVPAMTTFKQSRNSFLRREQTERELGVYADGVVYTIYILDDGEPKRALKAAGEGLNARQGWNRDTEQIVNCGDFTGKQYTSSDPLGGTLQVFATRNRFYKLQAFGAPATDPRVKQFFSSLTLGKKNDGIEIGNGPGVPLEPLDRSPTEIPFTGKQVDRKIRVLQKPEPSYTEEARQRQITGTVVLKTVFSAGGSVLNIIVVSGLPSGLTEKAIQAAQKIKFIPAAKDGKLVSSWIQLEYNFNLY